MSKPANILLRSHLNEQRPIVTLKGDYKSIVKRIALSIALIVFCSVAIAASVDTVDTFSPSMNKNIKAVVILPKQYKGNLAMPVLYLLHGYSGYYADWLRKVPALTSSADTYNMIIVCPDGNFSSWYFDSPLDASWKYETYISNELVSWIDGHYKTFRNPKMRAISGLSMGGHGAMYLGIRHQDVFGAIGSTSGGLDIIPFPKNWDIAQRLGSYSEYPDRWKLHSAVNLIEKIKPGLALIFDCGTEDFFYGVNVDFHQKLLQKNIPHDFISRPGGHNDQY